MMKTVGLITGAVALVALGVVGSRFLPGGSHGGPVNEHNQTSSTQSGYAELVGAEIRGIDPETVDGYLRGSGLGMALPAELNSYPGPRHVLELADQLELTDSQREKIQGLYDGMEAEAIELGTNFLQSEADLESAFRLGQIDQELLRTKLGESAAIEARLRFTHLVAHIATVDIISEEQVALYDELRGYGSGVGHTGH